MARYIGPKAKIARKFGENIFGNSKISKILEKKNYSPGQHGPTKQRRSSNYGLQLREKQKIKHMYGVLERQFRKFFKRSDRMDGETGLNLLQLLERRLDNVVYRMGFAPTRSAARQLVSHKHFKVNGVSVNIPSYKVKGGDTISLTERAKKQLRVQAALALASQRGEPEWVEVSNEKMEGVFKAPPDRQDLPSEINESLIVELYSK